MRSAIAELRAYFAGVDHAEIEAILEQLEWLAKAIDQGILTEADLEIDNALLNKALDAMSGSSFFDHAPEGMFETDTDLGLFTPPDPQVPEVGDPLASWEAYAQGNGVDITVEDIGVKAAGGLLAKTVPGPVGFVLFQLGPTLAKGFKKAFLEPPDWTAEEAAKAVQKDKGSRARECRGRCNRPDRSRSVECRWHHHGRAQPAGAKGGQHRRPHVRRPDQYRRHRYGRAQRARQKLARYPDAAGSQHAGRWCVRTDPGPTGCT